MLQKNSAPLIKIIIPLFLFVSIGIFAQDSTRSEAYKNNFSPKYSIRYNLTRPSYPLVAKFNLIQKANQGDPVSQHELGLRYLLGEGFEADTSNAVKWIKKAADKNFVPAKYNYGLMLLNGIGTEWDPFAAFGNFEYAAEQKFPEAQFVLGLQYLDGLVVNKNYEKGISWLRESARAKYKPAIEVLNQMKVEGAGLRVSGTNKPDTSKVSSGLSLDYLNLMPQEEQNEQDTSALENIISSDKKALRKKFGITDTTFYKAGESNISAIESAANYGSPEALYILGRLYETGKFVKKNKIRAASYYLQAYRLGNYKSATSVLEQVIENNFFPILKPAVDKGEATALYVIAGLAAVGLNFQITEEQLLNFLQSSADQNYIPALLELGLIYYSGELLDQDKVKAVSLWERAANAGSREAEIRLASTEIFSEKPFNLDDEISLLKDYSGKGSVLAKTILAFCYKNGIGVEKNKHRAANLFRDAASRGNETAWRSLQNMYDEIRPETESFKIIK